MKITNPAKIEDEPIAVATIKDSKVSEKICFVISPIGEPDSFTGKRADDVYNYVIRKVVEPLGYKVVRADEINESGLISPQILKHLKEDSLVIAYLAEDNPNVFFELAIRYVTTKPYIQLKEPSQMLPFDIKDTRTIVLDTAELKSVDEAEKRLKGQIDTIGEWTPNPISAALQGLTLQESKNPTENVLGNILSKLSEIQATNSVTGKMPADQEMAIRQEVEEFIAKQIWEPISLLMSALRDYQIEVRDKQPVELKEDEVKKIEEAFQKLMHIHRVLTVRQRHMPFMRTMFERTKPP